MHPGLAAAIDFHVTGHDTAEALGSGDLAVLGTPRLVAWLEAASCAAVRDHLPIGTTTVGTRVAVEHRAPSGVGAVVTARAALTQVDGRLLTFEVEATDAPSGNVVGRGHITRAVVDRERFLATVAA